MAQIPDNFELVTKGKNITVMTKSTVDQIRIADINLNSEMAAALARLINLQDGDIDLRVEVSIKP